MKWELQNCKAVRCFVQIWTSLSKVWYMSRKSPHFCLSLLLYDCARLLVQYCLSQTFLKIAVQCFLSSWSNIERKCSRPGWIVHTLYCVHFRLSSKELGLTKLNVVYVSAWVKGSLNVLLSMRLLLLQIWQTYLTGHNVTISDLGLDVLSQWSQCHNFGTWPGCFMRRQERQAVAPLANSFEMHLWIIRLFSDPLLFVDTCTKITLLKYKLK